MAGTNQTPCPDLCMQSPHHLFESGYYSSYFADEEMEAQRGYDAASTVSQGGRANISQSPHSAFLALN